MNLPHYIAIIRKRLTTPLFQQENSYRILSKVLLIVLSLNTVANIFMYFSKRFVQSPLIPDFVYEEIAMPYLISGCFNILPLLAAGFFFFRKNYRTSIAISVAVIFINVLILPVFF